MIDFVIYGKIIVDAIRLASGEVVRNLLGGGGPQGAFGARIWNPSVGLSTRSGTDLEKECRDVLQAMDINLDGWVEFPEFSTPHGGMAYDDKGYMLDHSQISINLAELTRNMSLLLANPINLPPTYQSPKAIHLISEFAFEPMVKTAMELKQKGILFSLEPLVDFRNWGNKTEITGLIRQADTATPDWPSACGIANSDDPLTVLKFWSKLGPQLICLRDGARGSYVWDCIHDECWHIPPVPVQVVDPTGAGNSYGGGMCVGWVETQDARQSGCYGSVSASFLVESVGMPIMTYDLQIKAKKRLEWALEASKRM
jgi:cytidine kinase